MGNRGLQTAVRLHYGKILQNIVYAGVFWRPSLGHEMNAYAALRKPPNKERATIDCTLEPFEITGIEIEEYRDRLVLIPSILADLKFSCVRRCAPIDVP